MPITPHESIAGHRFSYNRLRASRGRGLEPGPFESPLRARLAALPGARCPAQLTSFCPAPSKHLGKSANGSPGREAQRGGAPGLRTRITGQVRVRAMQARTHTSTRAQRCLRSAHTQLAQLPYPPAPPPPRLPFQRSFGQLKIVNRPTPQTSALFSGPHGLSGSLGTS